MCFFSEMQKGRGKGLHFMKPFCFQSQIVGHYFSYRHMLCLGIFIGSLVKMYAYALSSNGSPLQIIFLCPVFSTRPFIGLKSWTAFRMQLYETLETFILLFLFSFTRESMSYVRSFNQLACQPIWWKCQRYCIYIGGAVQGKKVLKYAPCLQSSLSEGIRQCCVSMRSYEVELLYPNMVQSYTTVQWPNRN